MWSQKLSRPKTNYYETRRICVFLPFKVLRMTKRNRTQSGIHILRPKDKIIWTMLHFEINEVFDCKKLVIPLHFFFCWNTEFGWLAESKRVSKRLKLVLALGKKKRNRKRTEKIQLSNIRYVKYNQPHSNPAWTIRVRTFLPQDHVVFKVFFYIILKINDLHTKTFLSPWFGSDEDDAAGGRKACMGMDHVRLTWCHYGTLLFNQDTWIIMIGWHNPPASA